MNQKSKLILFCFAGILVISFCSGLTGANHANFQGNQLGAIQQNETIDEGYHIAINISQGVATINYTKIEESIADPKVKFTIDGYTKEKNGPSLRVGESWVTEIHLSSFYDVTKERHDIDISTWGPNLQTTIYKSYNLEDPKIPATRIHDVEVIEATYNGESTAAIDVVFKNPSPRYYQAYVFAHTLQTHGVKRSGSVPLRNETMVERIHLREGPDEEVEGELRMTTARLDEDKGLRDQVWFRGTADGETEWQREPYEPVGYRNSEDPYRYDTDEGFLESRGLSPKHAAAGAALGIGFLVFLFRGRSKW